MFLRRSNRLPARRAAVAVEAAVVLPLFFLFLFSIFEYGRIVMLYNLMVNATREGGRYALVHSQDPTVVDDVTAEVKRRLASQVVQFPDLTVQVFSTNNPSATLDSLNPDDPVTVKVSGTFRTIFPTLVLVPVSIKLSSATVMTCEGN